jgi:DNA helicase-2/ATP-dependent DNA helicase PcrA
VLKWVINLLRVCVNTNDFSSAIYVLSNKEYGERMTENAARKIVKEQNTIISELLEKMYEFIHKVSDFTNPEDIYDYFEFDKYIRPTSAAYIDDKEAIFSLLKVIMEYVKEKQKSFVSGLREFINSSALYGMNVLKRDINNDTDSVKIMTLHASKGLEFSHVFIIGVNYGLIPLHTRDMEEEEEQRLFFVGITRAKDYLELSYYTNPDYQRVASGESRYINMIPKKLIENDKAQSANVSLQELKKQIQEVRNQGKKEEENLEKTVVEAVMQEEEIEKLEEVSQNENTKDFEQATKEEKIKNLETINEITIKQVIHKKYGKGKVLREDDMMLEVEFENYGVKEFIKAFSELELL